MLRGIGALLCLSAIVGCAGTNPEVCTRAIELRRQASRASGEERSLLEAKALGLEAACAREREGLYNMIEDGKRREADRR